MCDIPAAIVVVMAAQGILQMAGMLGEDGKGFLQFELLSIENMMSNYKHWRPLQEEERNR